MKKRFLKMFLFVFLFIMAWSYSLILSYAEPIKTVWYEGCPVTAHHCAVVENEKYWDCEASVDFQAMMFAPSISDIISYLGKSTITKNDIRQMFWDSTDKGNDELWLRTVANEDEAFCVNRNNGDFKPVHKTKNKATRAVFDIDLSKCSYRIKSFNHDRDGVEQGNLAPQEVYEKMKALDKGDIIELVVDETKRYQTFRVIGVRGDGIVRLMSMFDVFKEQYYSNGVAGTIFVGKLNRPDVYGWFGRRYVGYMDSNLDKAFKEYYKSLSYNVQDAIIKNCEKGDIYVDADRNDGLCMNPPYTILGGVYVDADRNDGGYHNWLAPVNELCNPKAESLHTTIKLDYSQDNYRPSEHVYLEKALKFNPSSRVISDKYGMNKIEWYMDPEFSKPVEMNYQPNEGDTLYAKPIYRIDYNLDGGDIDGLNPLHYSSNDKTILKKPTKEGYAFAGWTWQGQDVPTKEVSLEGMSGNLTFTANWSNTIEYNIKYNLDGGDIDGANPSYYASSDKTILIQPTKEGYVFDGWTWQGQNVPTKEVSLEGMSGDLTFTANWHKIIEYNVKYDLDGGKESQINPVLYTEYSNDIVLSNPTKLGCSFAGWTGTGIDSITDKVTIPKGSTGNREYKAHWVAERFEIQYDLEGGVLETPNPVYYYVDTETFVLKNPTKPGYKFRGWIDIRNNDLIENVVIEKGSVGRRGYIAIWERDRHEYEVKGKEVYKEKSETDLEIKTDADFKKFANVVKIDGIEIAASNYSAKGDSTIITLMSEYLEALGTGEHTIEIEFIDGVAKGTFEVVHNDSVKPADEEKKEESSDLFTILLEWLTQMFENIFS